MLELQELNIKDMIYTIRGQQVMLDFELAEIYGYTTKAFNQQVKNNIDKFDDDFRFQLTKEEFENLRSKKLTSSWGGTSFKDASNKFCTILRVHNDEVYHGIICKFLHNELSETW